MPRPTNGRGGPAIDGDRTQIVVANNRRGSRDQLDIGDRAQRDEITLGRAHAHSKDIFDLLAICRVGLNLDLPGAAKAIEVVDIRAAHRGLQCAEYVANRDSQSLGPLAVQF